MRPEMGRDNGPHGRYADLLGDGAGLAEIVGALDGLYGQGEPPAHVAAAIERAMVAQATHVLADFSRDEQLGRQRAREGWDAGLSPWGSAAETGTKGSATMTMTRKRLSTLAAVAAAVAVVGLLALLLRGFGPGSGLGSNGGPAIATAQAQVFAHSGGIEVVATLSCLDSAPSCDAAAAQQQVMSILTHRLSSALTDVPASTVQPLGATDIVIDVAGYHPASDILPLLDVGGFEVVDTGPTQLDVGTDMSGQTCVTGCHAGQYQVQFTSTDLDTSSIQVELNPTDGQPIITFAFKGAAQTRFAQYTGSHVGQYLTIVIDHKVVESATIQSQIDGLGQVEGPGTAQQARNLAAFMKYGALPVALKVVNTQMVGVGNQRSGGPFVCPTPGPFYQPCAGQSGAACAPSTATAAIPTATPAPQAKYVQNVTTAAGVSPTYSPVNPTAYFPINTDVYVVASVRNITAGQQHTISIHWFLDNQDLDLVSNSGMSKTITQDSKMYFSLTYRTPGLGTAKIYFDRPANDPAGDTAYLAATVTFLIQQAGATATPTPTPVPYSGGSSEGVGPSCATPAVVPTATPGDSGSPPPPGPTPTPPPTPPPTPTPTTAP